MHASNEEILEDIASEETVNGQSEETVLRDVTNESVEPEAQDKAAEFALQFKSPDDLLTHKLQYKANGKDIDEDISTILKRASQGYNYSQSMAEFKQRVTEYEPKFARADELSEKYGRFEEYAKENPKWAEHWENAWQNKDGTLPSGDALSQEPGEEPQNLGDLNIDKLKEVFGGIVDERLQSVQKFVDRAQNDATVAEQKSEDEELFREIQSTRDEYKGIDFDYTDPDKEGMSLEQQVIHFQSANNMGSFKTAFKAFYHDQLLAIDRKQQKEAWLKENGENQRAGIVPGGRSTSRTQDFSKSSYDQITDFIIKQEKLS